MRRSSQVPVNADGFTLMEVIVVMGILSSFMVMLVQLLGSGVEMYGRGQRGQDLADRAHLAVRATTRSLETMIGPIDRGDAAEGIRPDARLISVWEPLGFQHEAPKARVQVVRATVGLDEGQESELLRAVLEEEVAEEFGFSGPTFEEEMVVAIEAAPKSRRADLLLLPWPTDPDGVFMSCGRGWFRRSRTST